MLASMSAKPGNGPAPIPTTDPWSEQQVQKALKLQARLDAYEEQNFDGFRNTLTGIGDWTQDKTLGGNISGPDFDVTLVTNVVAEMRWRGSDLGGRIVETVPDEMTREGWEMTIQPDDGDNDEDDTPKTGAEETAKEARLRGDAFPNQGGAPVAAPSHPALAGMPDAPQERPGPIRELDDYTDTIEEIEATMDDLGAMDKMWEALCYERAYGGAAILIGADDGLPITEPLDLDRIKTVDFLNALTGGWDGEVVAWSYYRDPMKPNYGLPEMYMLRNLGVPIAKIPAPGEAVTADIYGPDPRPSMSRGAGSRYNDLGYTSLVTWIHESRLLVFPGVAVSRRARVQMRGWGDSLFTRIDRVLSQYDQTWGGVANLMSDFSQAWLKITGLAEQMGGNNKRATTNLLKRAQAFKLGRSIANIALIDKEEDFGRDTASLAGISDMMQQFSLRLAAAADMPVDLLMGQTAAGGLNKGDTTYRFFADRIVARQRKRLLPQLKRLMKILLLAKKGPTKGQEPGRWKVAFRSPYQMTEQEKAQLRLTCAQADDLDVKNQVLSPEEVASSAYGGSDYSTARSVDIEGRQKMADQDQADKDARAKAMVTAATDQQKQQQVDKDKAHQVAMAAAKNPKPEPDADPVPDKNDHQDADTSGFNPDQPRDKTGKWTAGGAGAGATANVPGGGPANTKGTGFSGGGLKKPYAAPKGGGIAGSKDGPSRSKMPQIRSADREEFRAYLKEKGIKSQYMTAKVGDLKPTQAEISASKVESLKGAVHPDEKPIMVAEDNQILDGHHRWAGLMAFDKDQHTPVLRIKAPIEEAIKAGNQFPKAEHHSVDEKPGPRDSTGREKLTKKVDHWVEHMAGLPKETWMSTMTGNPATDNLAKPQAWRQPLHDRITSEALDKVKAPAAGEQKVAILTMGGPASGKSSLVKGMGLDETKFVKVDPDGIKERLPEYKEAAGLTQNNDGPRIAARDAALMAHEESSYIAKKIAARAISEGKHVIVDGTGTNETKMTRLADTLHQNGYHVHLVYADLTSNAGIPRIIERAQKTGRWVPEEFARKAYKNIPENFQAISKKADTFQVFDASGPKTVKVWSHHRDGSETMHNEGFVHSFKAKYYKTGNVE